MHRRGKPGNVAQVRELGEKMAAVTAMQAFAVEQLNAAGMRVRVGATSHPERVLGGDGARPASTNQGYSPDLGVFAGNPARQVPIWERAAARVRSDPEAPEGYWTRKYLLYLAAAEETINDLDDPARRIIALTQLIRDYGRVFTVKANEAHLIAAEKGVDYAEEVKGMTDEELAEVVRGVDLNAPAAKPKQKWTRGGYREKLAGKKTNG